MNVQTLIPDELSIIEIDVDSSLSQPKVREILNEYTDTIKDAAKNTGRIYNIVCVPKRS
jgi:hypothetical protein